MLFVLPGGLRPYEAVVMAGAGGPEAAEKPDLMLLTALPLVWGELGPLDASSRPAAAFRSLEREFASGRWTCSTAPASAPERSFFWRSRARSRRPNSWLWTIGCETADALLSSPTLR